MSMFTTTSVAAGAIVLASMATASVATPAAHAASVTQRQSASATKTPVLRYGMRGAPVRLAQQKLGRDGYHVAVDGSFGPRTLGAVKAFQRAQGIAVDGNVGPITWSRLDHPRPVSKLPTLGLVNWGGGGTGHTRGYGSVRPGIVDNGGDPTGLVTRVTWSNWGGHTVTGTGMAWYVAPNKAVVDGQSTRASILAYDLTTCGGHPAYRHVIWWFPSKGETLRSALTQGGEPYDLCTGS